jgi:DNA-binding MarR family transcriptional regulator
MEYEIRLVELFGAINRRLWKFLAPVIKELELSMTEMLVLHALTKKGKCRATELATHIGVPTSTLTGIADRLEAGGYLEREHDPEDRRSVVMQITPKVGQMLDAKKKSISETLNARLAPLPADRKKRLVEDLSFILHSLEETEAGTIKAAARPRAPKES